MVKTKAYALLGVILLLVPLVSSLIETVKASSYWNVTWHNYFNYSGSPINRSSTTIVFSADYDYWVEIALVVSIYDYNTDAGVDAVAFRVALYFDSFADKGLYPVPAEYVVFKIDKDNGGSNLGDQAIEVLASSDIRPGCCQGGNLSQWGPEITSDYEDRAWWALKALGFAVGLLCEPVGVAMGLIDLATAFAPNEGTDFQNAGWSSSSTRAYCWWRNPGYDFGHANPVRQYAHNTIRWLQDWSVEPDTYYGIKVWASVPLSSPNPFGVGYINIPPISLRIYNPEGGGCPYVSTWNGSTYVVDNNVLGMAEVSNGSDVEDFYRLERTLVPTYQGRWFSRYSLQISEFENEHSYMDKAKLYAVDHDPDINVALTPEGQILTYSDPNPPISAIDNYGYDWLPSVSAQDDIYYRGFPGDYLLLGFGSLDVSQAAKLVLRANVEWKKETCIHVQTLNETGGWTDAATLRTRNHWSTIIVDLSDYLPNPDGTLKIRLYFTGIHKIDYVGLDTTPQADITTMQTNAVRAIHSTHGDVTLKLLLNDQVYADLLPGEQVELKFILPNNTEEARTFIIYIEGHYETIP